MKERLTGAIILVVLIVLLVPELLSGPSRSAPAPQTATSTEEPPLRSYTIDLADDTHGNAASSSATQELPTAPAPAQPTESNGASEQGDSAEAAKGPLTAGAAAQPPAAPSPQTQPGSAPAQNPAPQRSTRAAAVTERPPAEGAAGAWMVQLGVFANHANADRLAQQLREKGFHASVTENGSGSRTLWRVRAGPVADRTAAEQLDARLRAAGHPGSVVPK